MKTLCLFAFKSVGIIRNKEIRGDDNYYIECAKKRIDEVRKVSDIHIIVLTNQPEKFNATDNLDIIHYKPNFYSYSDKILLCEYALKKFDTVYYLDVDTSVDYSLFENNNIESGYHILRHWQPRLDFFKDLLKMNTEGYYEPIKKYCENHNLNYLDAHLIGECFFIYKRTKNDDLFFKIFKELKNVMEKNDLEIGNYPLGGSEGLLVGISLLNSKVETHFISDTMKQFSMSLINHVRM